MCTSIGTLLSTIFPSHFVTILNTLLRASMISLVMQFTFDPFPPPVMYMPMPPMSRSSGLFIIYALNFLNSAPCNGFVKWSPNLSSVGQCLITRSPFSTQSFMKYLHTLICFCFLCRISSCYFPIILCSCCPGTIYSRQPHILVLPGITLSIASVASHRPPQRVMPPSSAFCLAFASSIYLLSFRAQLFSLI